jgi:DNA-binding NtrC family response regulator
MKELAQWSWPGNVRELENLIERSVILSEGSALRVPLSELQTYRSAETEAADHSLDTAERQHNPQRVARNQRSTLGAERRCAQAGPETHDSAIQDAEAEDYAQRLLQSQTLIADGGVQC